MNKQELLTQADYTFQRGNRDLAKKYLTDLLNAYPEDEPAWMLLAKVVEEKERKIEIYKHILTINPRNEEAKLALLRVQATVNPTLPLPKQIKAHAQAQAKLNPLRTIMRSVVIAIVIVLLFGTTTYVIARNNPNSPVAQAFSLQADATAESADLADDVAPQTRADVNAMYPQFAPVVDTLLALAMDNANNGMEGAPERPGDPIITSDSVGDAARVKLQNGLPQPGSMSTVTLTEQEITSWLALEMKNSPDLPLSDVQVYLRDGSVQVWGMVAGSENSTSVLLVGELMVNESQQPTLKLESAQIGQQVIPNILIAQIETWLNQALTDAINTNTPGLKLVSAKVTSGLVTVSGTR